MAQYVIGYLQTYISSDLNVRYWLPLFYILPSPKEDGYVFTCVC